jgi:hypothetical protein
MMRIAPELVLAAALASGLFTVPNFAPPALANLVAFNSTDAPQTGTFGQLISTQGQNRIIQVALKFLW